MHLGERLGAEAVAAHHGSLSRARRFQAEQRLKSGRAQGHRGHRLARAGHRRRRGGPGAAWSARPAPSPPVSSGSGRSGHAVGGTPKGRLLPADPRPAGRMRRAGARRPPGRARPHRAAGGAARHPGPADGGRRAPRRSGTRTPSSRWSAGRRPTRSWPAKSFDAVVEMLSEGIASHRGRSGALLHRDARQPAAARAAGGPAGGHHLGRGHPRHRPLRRRARAGRARSSARSRRTSPSRAWRATSSCWATPPGASAGWRTARVRVEDAAGRRAHHPVLAGRGAGPHPRAVDRGGPAARGDRRAGPRRGSRDAAAPGWRRPAPSTPAAPPLLRDYVLAGRAALGAVPSADLRDRRTLLRRGRRHAARDPRAVRRPDQPGLGHGPAQALLPHLRLRAAGGGHRRRGDPVAGPAAQLPAREHLRPAAARGRATRCSTQAVLQAPMFETRWRWNAARALALLRRRGGKKVPPNLQRMRAQDLLAAVFPGQTACQDNHGGGPIEVPDHPLVERDGARLPGRGHGRRRACRRCSPGCTRARSAGWPGTWPSRRRSRTRSSTPTPTPSWTTRPSRSGARGRCRCAGGCRREIVDSLGALDPEAVGSVVAEAQPSVASRRRAARPAAGPGRLARRPRASPAAGSRS